MTAMAQVKAKIEQIANDIGLVIIPGMRAWLDQQIAEARAVGFPELALGAVLQQSAVFQFPQVHPAIITAIIYKAAL